LASTLGIPNHLQPLVAGHLERVLPISYIRHGTTNTDIV